MENEKEFELDLLATKKFQKTKNRQFRSFFCQRALVGDENHKGVMVEELLIEMLSKKMMELSRKR